MSRNEIDPGSANHTCLLWSGPHLIFHAAHQHADSALSSPVVLAPVLLIFAALSEEMT